MTFIETFGAVFMATIFGQIAIWWFKKELEHRIDAHYEKIKGGIKNVKSNITEPNNTNNTK